MKTFLLILFKIVEVLGFVFVPHWIGAFAPDAAELPIIKVWLSGLAVLLAVVLFGLLSFLAVPLFKSWIAANRRLVNKVVGVRK